MKELQELAEKFPNARFVMELESKQYHQTTQEVREYFKNHQKYTANHPFKHFSVEIGGTHFTLLEKVSISE